MTREKRKIAAEEFKEWRDSYYNKNKLPATMFIEEVIKILEQEPSGDLISKQSVLNACEQSINILEAVDRIMDLPSVEQEPCDDAVSRADVRHLIAEVKRKSLYSISSKAFEKLYNEIDDLPPVNPQPKTGHWFVDERPESDREVICSNCEQPIFKYHKLDFDYRPKYCPNCGVKMVEPQERSDKG